MHSSNVQCLKILAEAVVRSCSLGFLKTFENSTEKPCVGVSFQKVAGFQP